MQPSILWHDYETWGVNPQKDVPCQFAGIRTDLELNIIDKPVKWYCQIPNDYLPHPRASMVTGITPQHTLRDGLIEPQFMAKIHQQMTQPGTCSAGYNSIRFDDEVTRHSLYRNFYDPYGREWQNGNSRWDIIDVIRACYALRPDGLQWVFQDNGTPSFKLELLSQANNIHHQDAHDALADVHATIELAKKIRTAQPKLYDFLFQLRFKNQVIKMIDVNNRVPLVHVSSKLPASQGCCTWIVPIAYHPENKNAVICMNLQMDPTPLFELDIETIKQKMYQPSHLLQEGEQRLPIKLVHVNKCPVIAPAKTLDAQSAERLGIDRELALKHLEQIRCNTELTEKLTAVFLLKDDEQHKQTDADFALYQGGFINDNDRSVLNRILSIQDPQQLSSQSLVFDDPRLATLLFRYRARNFPQTLDQDELTRWQRHREYRLTDPQSPASIHLADYISELEQLSIEYQNNPEKQAIIRALYQYAENL